MWIHCGLLISTLISTLLIRPDSHDECSCIFLLDVAHLGGPQAEGCDGIQVPLLNMVRFESIEKTVCVETIRVEKEEELVQVHRRYLTKDAVIYGEGLVLVWYGVRVGMKFSRSGKTLRFGTWATCRKGGGGGGGVGGVGETVRATK